MALPTAVLIAVKIKSAYLPISCEDLSSRLSPELSAATGVDSNFSVSLVKGPVKLIKRVKIAHSFLQAVSN